MQSRGLDFLQPIWKLINEYLKLSENDVEVTYTRYVNNYKKDAQTNDKTINEAVEAGLTPGMNF